MVVLPSIFSYEKYRWNDDPGMQVVHNKSASIEVQAYKEYDTAKVMQEKVRRICSKL